MNEATYWEILWRQKAVVVAATVVAALAGAGLSVLLPDTYTATSKLLVAQDRSLQTFDSVQAAQIVARTYSELLRSEGIADRVAERLSIEDADSFQDSVSVEPVTETQLIEITADSQVPSRAKAIADEYAEIFTEDAANDLSNLTSYRVSVAETAPLPESPSRPRPLLYTLIAGFLGLIAGSALALLRDRQDTRLRTTRDLEREFDLPVIGRIPSGLPGSADEDKAFAESFSVLRVNLRVAGGDREVRMIVVTSAHPGEGKTLVARELASAYARADSSVLLVDGDVHRPTVSAEFGLRGSTNGNDLVDYLAGGSEVEEVIRSSGERNLRVLPAERTNTSLSALIEAPRGATAYRALADRANIVIVDAPPLIQGADATALAMRADAVVLVVDLSRATMEEVRNSIERLQRGGGHVLGFVVNREPQRTTYEYYGAARPPLSKAEAEAQNANGGRVEKT